LDSATDLEAREERKSIVLSGNQL